MQQSQDLSLQHEHELVETLAALKEHKKCVGLSLACLPGMARPCKLLNRTDDVPKTASKLQTTTAMSRCNNESTLLVGHPFFRFQSDVYLVILLTPQKREIGLVNCVNIKTLFSSIDFIKESFIKIKVVKSKRVSLIFNNRKFGSATKETQENDFFFVFVSQELRERNKKMF